MLGNNSKSLGEKENWSLIPRYLHLPIHVSILPAYLIICIRAGDKTRWDLVFHWLMKLMLKEENRQRKLGDDEKETRKIGSCHREWESGISEVGSVL